MKKILRKFFRSGSMSGSRIECAKKAMLTLLDLLPEKHCLFNIVGFGSSHNYLFVESTPTTKENIIKAQNHIVNLNADLGGKIFYLW